MPRNAKEHQNLRRLPGQRRTVPIAGDNLAYIQSPLVDLYLATRSKKTKRDELNGAGHTWVKDSRSLCELAARNF